MLDDGVKNMNQNPLVTIIVATYNQEKIVSETLNSVLKQSYSNIELIITDDYSTDGTVLVCENWMLEHKERFYNCVLVKSIENTGIACSLNRALERSNGEWIRIVAGDDLLPNKSIEQYVDYVNTKGIKTICNSFSAEFVDNGKPTIVGYRPDAYLKKVYSFEARKQYSTLIREGLCFIGCTVFISRSFLKILNGYDETFPMIEDWPMFLKATSLNEKVYFAENIIGCFHRVGQESISNTSSSFFSVRAYGKDGLYEQLIKTIIKPYRRNIGDFNPYHNVLDKLRRYTIIYGFKNKNNCITRFINKLFLSLDPLIVKRIIYNKKHNVEIPIINDSFFERS